MMESDPRIIVIGEDIFDPYGGAFKVTRGLSTSFPDRVFTTPLSEAAIVGMATGMAIRGLRPVAEIMFGDFLALGADQLINHAAKFRWMYNDVVRVPMVVRAPMGGRRGYGPTHSQCLEKHFLGLSGLWVVAPHILGDPGALIRQSTLECDDPVLFIESKTCYGRPLVSDVSGMAATTYSDDDAPFPTTYLHHREADATPDGVLFGYGGMVPLCLEAAQQLRDQEGLLVDVVAVTQLSPIPVSHIRAIFETACPTLVVYAEEANVTASWSAEMVAQIEELRASDPETPAVRHERVGADDSPVANSRELESRILPQVDDIVQRIVDCF